MKKILALLLTAVMVFALCGCDSSDYKKASALYDEKNYEEAKAMFLALGDYEDSAEKAKDCEYNLASAVLESKDYAAAASRFEALGDYKDSADLMAKAQDEQIREKLLGSWISQDVDFTEIFNTELSADAETAEILEYADFGTLVISQTAEFKEDGSYVGKVTEESAQALSDALISGFADAVSSYMEEEFKKTAEENGLTLDVLLQFYGVADVNALIEMSLGMTPADFSAELMSGFMDSMISGSEETGTYRIEKGVITLSLEGIDTECGKFDLAADKFILTEQKISEEFNSIYPIEYTRQ